MKYNLFYSYFQKTFLILLISFYPLKAYSSLDWLKKNVSEEVEIDYEMTCDSIIETIRKDSRFRMSSKNNFISIEQIYDRNTITISETSLDCEGVALMSNGEKNKVKYGAYIDEENDKVFFYNIE